MAIQQQGFGGVVQEVDGTTFRAARVTARPAEYGALGHYKVSMETGSVAAGQGADSEIWQFRWPDATRFAVVTLIQVDHLYATTAFAVGIARLRATVARTWSADGTGGATATLTGDNNQMRTTMGASLATYRMATTAALGAGTKTFDAQDIGHVRSGIAATANVNLLDSKPTVLFNPSNADGEHPLVLAQNEGVVVRATVPATGVWIAGITVRWIETAAF